MPFTGNHLRIAKRKLLHLDHMSQSFPHQKKRLRALSAEKSFQEVRCFSYELRMDISSYSVY